MRSIGFLGLLCVVLPGKLCFAVGDDFASSSTQQVALAGEIDAAMSRAWSERGLEPRPAAGDAQWLRRLSLDLRGTIPTVEELERFLADPLEDRRARKIDEYLSSRAFSAQQSLLWGRLLLADGGKIAERMGRRLAPFIEQTLAVDGDFGKVARALITATDYSGPDDASPVGFVNTYHDSIETLAGVTAKVFLGLQIQCAQCHDHPTDHWKQKEFNRFTGFYSEMIGRAYPKSGVNSFGAEDWDLENYLRRRVKVLSHKAETLAERGAQARDLSARGLSEGASPMEGRMAMTSAPVHHSDEESAAVEELRALLESGPAQITELKALRSRLPSDVQEEVDLFLFRQENFGVAAFLDGTPYEACKERTRREDLAAWITNPANPWFGPAIVNREWSYLFGHGLVEPVDDLSGSSDRAVPELLDRVAAKFVEQGNDLRFLVGILVRTRAYGLGNSTEESRVAREEQERWFAAHPIRPMTSDQFAQALLRIAGVDEGGRDYPKRRQDLLDRLKISFENDSTGLGGDAAARISQALFLMNAVYEDGARSELRPRFLVDFKDEEKPIEARLLPLFRATLGRSPTAEEVEAVAARFETERDSSPIDRVSRIFDDVLWAILNTTEFHSNH